MSITVELDAPLDNGPELLIAEIAANYGIAPETCINGLVWAREWHEILSSLHHDDPIDRDILGTAQSQALEALGEIPRDINGDPSFRTLYAAQRALIAMSGDRADEVRAAINGKGIVPIPHFDRLDEIVGVLLERYRNNDFPYYLDGARLPQDVRHMPTEKDLPRGSIAHGNFLFYSGHFMRGTIRSVDAFRRLSRVYLDHPKVFDPHFAKDMDEEELRQIFAENWLGWDNSKVPRYWIENSRRLAERYGCNAWTIIEGETDYRRIQTKMCNDMNGSGFIGFQEKMASMIIYYFVDARPELYFDFPLPSDFHVLRVLSSNEAITFESVPENHDILSSQTMAMIRLICHDYSVTHGISQVEVADALWLYSSSLCNRQPGNKAKEVSGHARWTIIEPAKVDFAKNPSQLEAFTRTCGLCALRQTCTSNLPSKYYYRKGEAVPSRRIEPTDTQLSPHMIDPRDAVSRPKPVIIPASDVLTPASVRLRGRDAPRTPTLF